MSVRLGFTSSRFISLKLGIIHVLSAVSRKTEASSESMVMLVVVNTQVRTVF